MYKLKMFIIVISLCLLPIYAHAKPWYRHSEENRITGGDVIREGAWLMVQVADLGQTRYIARHPDKYFETNKYLGKHPSIEEVNRFFLITTTIHIGVSYILPKKLMFGAIELRPREAWQYITIGGKINAVQTNNSIGIKYEW